MSKNEMIMLPREVVGRALDALARGCPPDCKDGMTDSGGVHPWGEAALIECPSCQAVEALRAALEQLQPDPYLYYDPANGDTWTQEAVNDGCCLPDGLISLYTNQKQAPLTDEQIDGIIRDLDPPWLDTPTGFEEEFCRAIERAHGIGGEA